MSSLRREVSELVGEINGELATPDWSPVIYLRRSVSRTELAALYGVADVAWVASLRDGMNLVAKEYVACQRDRAGVLLLSEFAGAAGEMGEAIRVNPYDEPGSADALERALTMPEDERLERQAALLGPNPQEQRDRLGGGFVAELRDSASRRGGRIRTRPGFPAEHPGAQAGLPGGDAAELLHRLRRHARPLAARPDRCRSRGPRWPRSSRRWPAAGGRPSRSSRAGRSSDLDRWFGHLKGIWIAAEHGALLRAPGDADWVPVRAGAYADWKDRVRPVLEHFAARAPGSIIEEKSYALAWHYRLVEPEFGDWLATEVVSALDQQLSGTDLAVLRGSKVVEVRFAWANKGEVAAYIGAQGPPADFELAIGDDRTDEDLFARLASDAWTIRVGTGPTRARFGVADPKAALGVLAALADTRPRRP